MLSTTPGNRLTLVLSVLLAGHAAPATGDELGGELGGDTGGETEALAADGVVRAAAPRYFPAGIEGGDVGDIIAGVVTVTVLVDASGRVEEATIDDSSGLEILDGPARSAALEWEFEPVPGAWSRSHRLTFSFDGAKLSDAPLGAQTSYQSPFTLHLAYNRPSILRLDPSSYGPTPPRCPVHDLPLSVRLAPTRCGGAIGISTDDPSYDLVSGYWDAKEALFPYAEDVVRGGCIVSSETSGEVLECPACREAKSEWLDDHPDLPARFRD